MGAPNKFGLTTTRTAVKSAKSSGDSARLRVLDKRRRCAAASEMFVENYRVERAGEQTTVVTDRFRH
ncbi:hypothetical protein A4X20_06285 [Mycolicibacterium iranicum]|uniref:Uncharacterized protein n=1 Tax=Mycolicibacterium iranicum TaxID=912594 RepID=A0A178LS27_MYCIR|nr:hypothetical protein A4X20_06285 [Mycolicibacterium iranicum]